MDGNPHVIRGLEISDLWTPLSWEELVMVISTGYGIRCPGGLQRAVTRRVVEFSGDSLAVPFVLTYIVHDLERKGEIRVLEGFANAFDRPDEGYNRQLHWGLSKPFKSRNSREQWTERIAELHQDLDFYTEVERDIICRNFEDGLLACLKTLSFTSSDEDAAFFLVNPNVTRVSRLDRIEYGGIGKVGACSVPPESMWNEIVVFPAEREDDGVANRYARQTLAILLKCYQHLTEHQRTVADVG